MKVGVLGAGTMGHGIAQVTAMAGHDVTLRDIEAEFVENGIDSIEANLQGGVERDKVTEAEKAETLDRISGTTDLETAVSDADMVVEAVPEKMDIKRGTFADVEEFVADDTIIASNTSSLSLTEIASALDDPSRAIGLHFFNPVHIMKLVEVVIPEQASPKTVEFASEFVDGIDKVGVEVNDSPGFASSRLGVALGVEAIRMLQEGVASPGTSTRRWNWVTTTRWVPSNSATWSGWTFASASSNTSARNWASGSARRRFSARRSAPGNSARRPAKGSTCGRTAKSWASPAKAGRSRQSESDGVSGEVDDEGGEH